MEELERAKDAVKSSLVLGMEDSLHVMRYNLSQELYQHPLTPEELIVRLDNISMEEISRELDMVINPNQMFVSLYGNLKGDALKSFSF